MSSCESPFALPAGVARAYDGRRRTRPLDASHGVNRLADLSTHALAPFEPAPRHGTKAEPLSQVFYDIHADAANTTRLLAANGTDPLDLSHVSFARVDYINVTEITSRWLIWK